MDARESKFDAQQIGIFRDEPPLYLKTECAPDARGRTPQPGEQKWTLDFPLEDGRTLFLSMGRKGRDSLKAMLGREEWDDLQEALVTRIE